ncbi:ADP-ribosylglycohydrolase family protein [Agromyces sp. NPDC058484]|uniref:ADP-ribosylglycohydrolase family protein n=1 Tax=Agromyces sp. NPDC058484 TaxID=3346524 RepID=UPI00364F71B1
MHDPLSAQDLLVDEVRQRRESGFDLAGLEHVTSAADIAEAERMLGRLEQLTRREDWAYVEPDDLDAIAAESGPAADAAGTMPDLDRFQGAWLGRIAGCNVGKPVEEGRIWTSARIREYLDRAGAFPLRDYVPPPDPQSQEAFALRESWPRTTRGNVNGSDRDDDIDYTILTLQLLERHGRSLSTADVADAWLAFLPYARVYTAERAVYVNLLHGVPPHGAGERRNPYREWIGALIRGDAYGWTHPDRPWAAARLAYRDAVLSHRANGIYGEMWSAALAACSLVEHDVDVVVERSLAVVPRRSRLAESIGFVRGLRRDGLDWDAALAAILQRFGHYEWVHTVNNAALITAGLLWSEHDLAVGVGNTVTGGWDTDSNGATVGSVLGGILGARHLPANLIDPLHGRTRSAVFGADNSQIRELAERTRRLATRFSDGA